MENVFSDINDFLNGRSHPQKDSTLQMMYGHRKLMHHAKNEADSMVLTSSKNCTENVKKSHGASRNTLNYSTTTLNQPASTVNTLTFGFPSNNQGPSTSAGNPAQGIYDHIPDLILGIINSKMKISDQGVNGLYAQAEKIRILIEISTKCNNLATKLKGKMKRQVDNLKPKHPNETLTQCKKELDTIMDGLPSTFANNSAQNISDVIPKRIKGIISETLSFEKKNSLSISNFEAFFNKAKNKRNIRCVAKSLKMPISRLKKQLKEIKMRYDRNPMPGNKEENQFMKRLERIINSLD